MSSAPFSTNLHYTMVPDTCQSRLYSHLHIQKQQERHLMEMPLRRLPVTILLEMFTDLLTILTWRRHVTCLTHSSGNTQSRQDETHQYKPNDNEQHGQDDVDAQPKDLHSACPPSLSVRCAEQHLNQIPDGAIR